LIKIAESIETDDWVTAVMCIMALKEEASSTAEIIATDDI
jgi:hypothetical protein